MSELEKYIQSYFGVTKEELSKIISFFTLINLKKGDHYLKAGTQSNRLGFVQSGILREFVVIDHQEITKWISTQGYFVVDLSSFMFDKPARWNIQALTSCELYVIGGDNYKKIGNVIPRWHELEKLFIARCFTVLEDRVVTHLSMTAEERYSQLFDFNKNFLIRCPCNISLRC